MSLVRFGSALLVGLVLCTSCRLAQNVRPAQVGDWRINGQSNALLSTQDGGDLGDKDTFRVGASAGRFIAENWMLEGIGTLEATKQENSNGDDTDTQVFTVGAGARYYFDTQSPSRPYGVVQAGIANVDIDDDATGIDDSDTAPFVRVAGGIELFLNDYAAVDLGLAFEQIFDLEIAATEDDLTTVSGFVGLSIWL
jgi:hypothetical protein